MSPFHSGQSPAYQSPVGPFCCDLFPACDVYTTTMSQFHCVEVSPEVIRAAIAGQVDGARADLCRVPADRLYADPPADPAHRHRRRDLSGCVRRDSAQHRQLHRQRSVRWLGAQCRDQQEPDVSAFALASAVVVDRCRDPDDAVGRAGRRWRPGGEIATAGSSRNWSVRWRACLR